MRLEAGAIGPGQLADLVAIDLAHLSLQPRHDLLKSVVYAMSHQAVTDVWVHGRRVVERGRLATMSEDELVARVAALTKGWRQAAARS
jgi:5-methylthioadenosine/S-adenosylhomocysteine deaminase